MEEGKGDRTLATVEGTHIQVWKITTTTIRRGHPWKHTRTERKCVWKSSPDEICGRTFQQKSAAKKHLQSHLKTHTISEYLAKVLTY